MFCITLQEQEEAACEMKKERNDNNNNRQSILPQQIGRRARYKASKSEKVIKPGRQDGKLVIFDRKCAYGKCEDCGTKKFFSNYKCALEWDDELIVEIKEYQDLERNNSDKKQKELVIVKISAMQLMNKVADTGDAVMKHIWQSHWGSHQRRYDNKPCIQIIYTFEESALKLLNSAFVSV